MFKNGRLEKETALSPISSSLVVPRFLQERGETKVLWNSAFGIQVESISPPPFGKKAKPSAPALPAVFLLNPFLDENIYICFGDSITYGYIDREPAPELGYVPRLEAILNQNFGPTLVINEGIGGENTILGLARIDSVLNSHAGRFILVNEGTNDVITPGLAMSTSAFNLQEMVRRGLAGGIFFILSTILPRKDWIGVIKYFEDRILELNQLIRQMVVNFPISFVDMYEIFDNYPASDGGLFAVLSRDLKHPSATGYQVMGESWFNEIKNIPFPPINIEIKCQNENISSFCYRPARFTARRAKAPLFVKQAGGTFLAWKDNSKIYDKTRIEGYKIYRKDRYHSLGRFRLLAFVRSPLSFFDPGLHTINRYSYVISAVRTDGVEGPCSAEVKD